jgi:uncharacterized membrane protein
MIRRMKPTSRLRLTRTLRNGWGLLKALPDVLAGLGCIFSPVGILLATGEIVAVHMPLWFWLSTVHLWVTIWLFCVLWLKWRGLKFAELMDIR